VAVAIRAPGPLGNKPHKGPAPGSPGHSTWNTPQPGCFTCRRFGSLPDRPDRNNDLSHRVTDTRASSWSGIVRGRVLWVGNSDGGAIVKVEPMDW